MKRISIIALLFCATIFTVVLNSYSPFGQTERVYKLSIPEHLIQPFYSLINGGSVDNLTVGQMKELTNIVNEQIQPQYKQFYVEDSTKNAKNKPDTTRKDSTKK